MPGIQAADFPTRNQVVTFVQNLEHLGNFQGIILKIAIQGGHEVTLGLGKAQGKRIGLAAIELETEPANKGVFLGKVFYNIPGIVPTAVIDNDDFVTKARRLYGRYDFLEQFRKIFAFFLDRDDHR